MTEKEEEVWKDDSSLKDVLTHVAKTQLNTNDVNKWIETLTQNMYTTVEHFKDISAEEWAALRIPLRIRTLIRRVTDIETEENPEYRSNARKKSRTLNSSTVKKAVSNSGLLITDFVGGVGSAVIDKTKSTVGRLEFPKVTRATSEGNVDFPDEHLPAERKDSSDSGSTTPNSRLSSRLQETNREGGSLMSSSMPKMLTRSKSSKLQRMISDTPFFNNSNNSSNSNNNSSSEREFGAGGGGGFVEVINPKGSIAIGGDSSACTKLLNYFSFYSKSQFFCSGEKTIDVIVYEEKVECKFENCSRIAGEESLDRDVIILTFSIIDPTSLNNLLLTYMPLLKKRGFPKNLVYIVGIEADKRDIKNRRHVSPEQTEQVIKNLRALSYCEIGRLDTKESSDNIQILMKNCAGLILSKEKTKANKFPNWIIKFSAIQKMISLQEAENEINLKKCRLDFLPVQLIFLRSFVTKLRLSSNLFRFFPNEILLMENLLELDLSCNQITSVPNSIKRLTKLTHLNLESNKLEMLPVSSLQEITTLQELKLKGNPLSQVPRSFLNRKKNFLLASTDDLDNNNNNNHQSILIPLSSPTSSPISPSHSLSPSPQSSPKKSLKNGSLFGVEIENLLMEDRKLIPHIRIPIFLQRAVNFIITSGMDKQGIFRMEGNANTIQELKDSFDTGIYIEFMKFEDVNNVTSLLKLWLRSLPTPILSNSVELLKAVTIDDEKKRMDQLRELIHQIPHPSFCVCACIIRLCDLINKNNENNKMDGANLSRVIATNLARLPENGSSSDMIGDIKKIQDLVLSLIDNYSFYFVNPNLSFFEQDYLSEFENPQASIVFKLSSNHKSITTMCICNTSAGKRLWVGDDHGKISVWNIDDIRKVMIVCNLDAKKRINCLLSVGDNVWVGCIENIQIRRALDGEMIKMIDHPGYNFQLTSKNSNIWSFLQSNISQIKVFDTKRMKVVKEFQIASRVLNIIKIRNEIWIACHNRKIYVYSIKEREQLKEISTEHQERMTAICAVGKNEVWSCAHDGIHIWDSSTKELKQKIRTTTELMGLMSVSDQVWSFSWDASIFVYNINTKEFVGKIKSYHNQPISTIISNYSPTNPNLWHNFTASYDHTFVIWQCRPLLSINK